MGDLEEVLLRNGGAWWQHRSRERPGYEQHFPEVRAMLLSRDIASINLAVIGNVTGLAVEQSDYNHLEDDDLQHLD